MIPQSKKVKGKIALVYISYDGILNCHCGVGTLTRSFVKSFPSVSKRLKESSYEVSLELITPALTNKADGYSDEILQESITTAEGTGGKVHKIINATHGDIQFGAPSNWEAASIAAANKVIEISQNFERILVYSVDTPFMKVPYYVEMQKEAFPCGEITHLLVPHSDVISHHGEDPNIQRLEWEAGAFAFSSLKNNIFIARTSEFLIEKLTKHYSISDSKVISLVDGLFIKDERFKKISQDDIAKKLDEYGIPIDKEIIFSVGRAVEYKGFDILIKSFSKLNRINDYHLVIIASPFSGGDLVIDELKELIQGTKIPCTAIFDIDFELPKYIGQWSKTKIVAQLARKEPFGLVPEEVRLWGQGTGPSVLASNLDGFKEQIVDGVDGFLVNIDSIPVVTEKIEYILQLKTSEVNQVCKNGYDKSVKEYDYTNSVYKSIIDLLKSI